MTKYNYTIIIPHYNIPKLLERCILSIPKRDDIQIIIVDDCSPDFQELHTVIEKLELLYRNLEFYRTEKGGSAGRARNLGLEHAKGKWVLFADADDFFDKCLSDFMNEYLDAEEEVIYFNFRSVFSENTQQISNRESTYNDFFKQYDKDHKEENFRFLYCTPWGKMIKRSLINNYQIRFDETRYANDAMFAVLIGCKAKTILPINIPIYVLTERVGSLANNFCRKPGETIIRAKVALRVRKTIIDHGYTFPYDYQIYVQILLWNKEFNDLLEIYHSIASYNLTKLTILKIVLHTGKRYYIRCLWLIWKDLVFKIQKK